MGSCCDDVLAGSHVWETGSQWSKWIKVTDVQHLNHCKSGDSGKNSVGLVYLFPQRRLMPAPAVLCRFWKGPSHYWISVAAATFPKTSLSQRQTLRSRLCSNAKRRSLYASSETSEDGKHVHSFDAEKPGCQAARTPLMWITPLL